MMKVDSIRNPSKVWRYFVHVPERSGYAVIYIDSSGLFVAHSEWGTYSYVWNHIGEGNHIRKFILGICPPDDDYALRKFAPHRVFDGEATARSIRLEIVKRRRERTISAKMARDEWDLVRNFDTEVELNDWAHATTLNPWENLDLCCYQREPQAVAFCQFVLPELAKQLTAELAKEQAERDRPPPSTGCPGCDV